MRRLVPLACSLLILGGCETMNEMQEGKKVDYKSATTQPSLEVPPDLTTPSRDGRYALPEGSRSSATLSGYQAERSQQARSGNTAVLPQVEGVRLERGGTQRWLVIQQPPERLWATVKDFWQENGLLVSVESPETGVMETDWAENRIKLPQGMARDWLGKLVNSISSTAERDKFRTRLDRTPDGQGTEIYVSHRGLMEVYASEGHDRTVWQPRPSDPELEAEFLRRLMLRFGSTDEKAKIALTAPAPQRAELRKGLDGTEALEVQEPFDRAWRRVGLALDRVGFTVEDRDRQKGIYFVRYADSDVEREKPGLLTKLFTSNDPKKAEQYRVQVTPGQDKSQVQVLNKEGAVEQSPTTQRILTLLHEQLK